MKKRQIALAAAICTALTSVGFVGNAFAAEKNDDDLMSFNLAEIVVHGQRYIAGEFVRATSNVGILGEQDAMKSPISTTTISEKAVGTFLSSTEGLSKTLSLVPSVVKTHDAAVDCVTIRGFGDDGRSFVINGIPGMQAMTRQSSNYIESVDVIEGPATGINGSSMYNRSGGTININSKKALMDEDTRKVGIKYHSKGAHEEYVDFGTRLGEDKRYGVRINASNTNGERSIENWNLKQKNIYINLDQETENSKTNFMFGYTDTDSQGRPYGLSVKSSGSDKFVGNALPSAPDGKINTNPSWRRDKNTNLVMTLNHEQKINDHLKAFLNAGHFKQDWYYYVGFSKTLLNEAGDFKATSDNWSLLEKRDYAQIGLKGDFKTGDLKHEWVAGVDRMWHYYGGPSNYSEESGWTGNIYHPNTSSFAPPTFAQANAYYKDHARISGWSVMDSITTGNDKLNILVGLNGKSIAKDFYKPDGSHNKKSGDYYDVSPSYGINYTFDPRVAVYASHTEDFVEGGIVGNGYANQGTTLDPYKTKQNEIGVKFKTGDFFHKISYFDIKKANPVDVYKGGLKYRLVDGEARHKGFEYTATGTLAEKWNLIGGFMHLNAKQKTDKVETNGKRPNGVPEWSANLGVEYKASDDFSVLMRGNYVGSSYVLDEKYGVPSYFTLDAGVNYKTSLNGTPVTLRAMCYNVTDKKYWTTESGANRLHSGGPRTFMLSAEFDI
ncbi:TonB-dependent receptor [uncultured Phascolarctobacterium sp.]|uniref:TonB-dependent receptor n=1 Tax=uncultured Phascolarctobacterium sp. TaxID=512296 RepID=UPI0027DB834C|nr:TonB-dependent receptor [uncultured Phascolarctobacterium sp.]